MILAPTALIAAMILFLGATLLGLYPVRRAIEVREARHELRRGSTGWIRTIAGWTIILVWSLGVWVAATILGDWAVTGDLEAAMNRGAWRIRIVLELLIALAASE